MEPDNYQEKTYSILELNTEIEQILEGSFSELVWVRGEITGFDKQKSQKNIFFQLQEKNPDKDQIISKISATIFNSDINRLLQKFRQANVGLELRDGLEVRVLCKIDAYPPWGEYKVIIKDIDPEFTLGKLAQSRIMIIQYLKDNGLLDKNKRLQLSLVPLSIGLITQKGKEGYTDFTGKLKESGFAFKIKFYNASVQGERVESEICESLDYFNQQKNIDVVVIVRGGGAKTDLSWFDNKKIAEKIALSQIPVLTGIGHKTDSTITDMVACLSQQSPSSAATFLVDRVRDFLQNVDEISVEITHSAQNYIRYVLQELKEMKSRINRESQLFLQKCKEEIDGVWADIISYCKYFFKSVKDTMDNYKSNVNFIDPINTIQRGFSITRVDGSAIKSINKVRKGKDIITTVSDGEIKSTVNLTKKLI